MRLFEAIIDANHRAVGGDQSAGVRIADFESELPVIALTCVDPRLNGLFPDVLGLPGEQFIWLRNAGNIVTTPLSSTLRSLALACVVKGGKEIAIIGHTDCQVAKTTTAQLIERFKEAGIERHMLPENINDYFGVFASEQQNVMKGCEIVRRSPLIGPKTPVHGLLVDVVSGKLQWIVNGYEHTASVSERWNETVQSVGHSLDALKSLGDFQIGEMKFPETKIGETVAKAEDWLAKGVAKLQMQPLEETKLGSAIQSAANLAEQVADLAEAHWPKAKTPKPPTVPPKIPYPPRIQPRTRRGGK
jgi:carbonic anhydrase